MNLSSAPPWKIHLIATVEEKSNVIGKNGGIPWNLYLAMVRSHRLMQGHPVIMDKATYQEWGYAIPGCELIVVSFFDYLPALHGAHRVCDSYHEARDYARSRSSSIFVIGGEELFFEALSEADTLYLTIVEYSGIRGDQFFPDYHKENFRIVEEEHHAEGNHAFTFATFERSAV